MNLKEENLIRIEIIGLDDLMAFVSIVRGRDVDVEQIRKVTRELDKSANALIKAEQEASKQQEGDK